MNAKIARDTSLSLSPADAYPLLSNQQEALENLERLMKLWPVIGLDSPRGRGKTTILRRLIERNGGAYIGAAEVRRAQQRGKADAGTDNLVKLIANSFADHDIVVIDDRRLLHMQGAREGNAGLVLDYLLDLPRKLNKTLIISGAEMTNFSISTSPNRMQLVELARPTAADYRVFFCSRLGEASAGSIDYDIVHRAAGGLSCRELDKLVRLIEGRSNPGAIEVIALIRKHILHSNVRTGAVEELSFESLPGSEAIASKLETHVILPLENQELAFELGLRAKRGVLLYGPPGTGKTSVGRALAHRMRGKFYLIDGAVATEPPADFFEQVRDIVAEAQRNAPAVLFIDDADVLFGIVHISGFARYLLTLLDGMESESAAKVCVIMTAMNAGKIPSAILRSGRIELWLETCLPDAPTRSAIVKRWLGDEFPGAGSVDFDLVAEQTERFTPADLRRVVGDAKALFTADEVAGHKLKRTDAYLSRAVSDLIDIRDRMAANLRDERLRIGKPVAQGALKYGAGIGGLAETNVRCVSAGW